MVFNAVVTTSASSATMKEATDVRMMAHFFAAPSPGSLMLVSPSSWRRCLAHRLHPSRRSGKGKGFTGEINFCRPHLSARAKRLVMRGHSPAKGKKFADAANA
jgi:hypothetical protein